ncbi:hypothetical protein HYPSUDRAFT_204401 [Hypholoma sublateritium FD-334 SS-4]|uniref:Uncharacterized protein n=1 Tax=Hypholoma sublateritium (strain FD-334 SS-4) TaxID=945553 RepID=A0A0D2NST9_HYPSF|nr:hypothetical protein HYPSUDRAFT_204401 [Hypholoma sublateritium FD-334 SS-4]
MKNSLPDMEVDTGAHRRLRPSTQQTCLGRAYSMPCSIPRAASAFNNTSGAGPPDVIGGVVTVVPRVLVTTWPGVCTADDPGCDMTGEEKEHDESNRGI